MDMRHIVVRGEKTAAIMKLRSVALQAFRAYFFDNKYFEAQPPTIVQTQVSLLSCTRVPPYGSIVRVQCEGGSSLFKVKYFKEDAYLTQSSQLYLETLLPSMGALTCGLLPC